MARCASIRASDKCCRKTEWVWALGDEIRIAEADFFRHVIFKLRARLSTATLNKARLGSGFVDIVGDASGLGWHGVPFFLAGRIPPAAHEKT
jgi:hypothetical protein